MDNLDSVRQRYLAVKDHLDERGRRMFAASEARAIGYCGVAIVSRATGIARSTIGRGLRDLDDPSRLTGNIRRKGSGRRPLVATDPTLLTDLRKIVEPATVGDPMRPLLWVSKSHKKLADALNGMGHKVSRGTIPFLLDAIGYRRQGNRKTKEGANHPDRDAQFEHINEEAIRFQAQAQPVISVDTKKKELVGDFKNAGTDYRPEGTPDLVRVHDFIDKTLGKAIPYGVYDISANDGWVSVGIDHDMAEFAVNSIRSWLYNMGRKRYPQASSLLITADCGGSNGNRVRLWKRELQTLSDETGLSITVCHYPPGTSKWNKIEHRLFCHITQNWRGKPLTSLMAIVELIAATCTETGLTVRCEIDPNQYDTATRIADADMRELRIEPANFHPDWNYTIQPRSANIADEASLVVDS
jgi:hypothetical protein